MLQLLPDDNKNTEREPQRLDRDAFNRPTLQVAHDLLGKFIVRNYQRRQISAMITEVEAYKGPKDLACHAARGRRTPRVEPLYADGGTVYIYLVYGIHWLLNFSTACFRGLSRSWNSSTAPQRCLPGGQTDHVVLGGDSGVSGGPERADAP